MKPEPEILVIRRLLPATREQVFAAWLDAESLARWMRPMGTTHATAEVDPRVGGNFRIVMMEGAERFEHRGEYLAIEPPSRLSFSWISAATDQTPTVVTVELFERSGGTELVLTHRRLPPQAMSSHRRGWTDIVRLLETSLRQVNPSG